MKNFKTQAFEVFRNFFEVCKINIGITKFKISLKMNLII